VKRGLFVLAFLAAVLAAMMAAYPPAGDEARSRLFAAIASPAASQARALKPMPLGELKIAIEGLRSASGQLLIGLYDSRASFDRAIRLAGEIGLLNDPDRVAGVALRASPTLKAEAVFINLPPGDYAVIVLHDVNGNGKLDKNSWGIPKEPYGFSNNAQGILGPPSFEDVRFPFDGCALTIGIALIDHGLDDQDEAQQAAGEPKTPKRGCAGF
jgi:uncharacterized protein (DUF2141 family)